MPLLTRTVGAPLSVDIRPGAVAGLAPLLADRRISPGGHVAVAVGPGQGQQIAAIVGGQLAHADIYTVTGGSIEAASDLVSNLRRGFYDALVGIGGGRTLDVAKYAATLTGLPMVAVATNLAHDGIASPVSSLEADGRKGSYGVQMPLAVVVDLDYVRRSPARMRRSGLGDVLSNLNAIADWHLAERVRGEVVDGLAVTFARTAAEAVLHRGDGIDDDGFLTALAEALLLSGMAMVAAGSSRPCSGACHEILHAVDALYPGVSNHGELAGVGALFALYLRSAGAGGAGGAGAGPAGAVEDAGGDGAVLEQVDRCLRRHGLPRLPADLGLTDAQFVRAVVTAPSTRPDRYTVLEHLDLNEDEVRDRVAHFVDIFGTNRLGRARGAKLTA